MDREKTFDADIAIDKLMRLLQGDIPCTERPFDDIGARVGMSEEEVITTVRGWLREGKIRRFGAILRHTEAGKNVNVMAAWKCPPEKLDKAGRIMAAFSEVSHCYEREVFEGWVFNLFTMIHANDVDHCERLVKEMSGLTGLPEYELLFTDKEYKKTSWQIEKQ